MYEPADLDSIVNIISQELDLGNFASLCNNVNRRLFSNNLSGDFQEITPPPLYITLTSNGVFNSKTSNSQLTLMPSVISNLSLKCLIVF